MTIPVPDVISAYFRLEVAEVFIDLTSHRAGSPEGQPGFGPVNRGNLDNNRSAAPRNVLVGARASDIAT